MLLNTAHSFNIYIGFPETSVTSYKTTRRNIPLERRPQLQYCESLECPKNSY